MCVTNEVSSQSVRKLIFWCGGSHRQGKFKNVKMASDLDLEMRSKFRDQEIFIGHISHISCRRIKTFVVLGISFTNKSEFDLEILVGVGAKAEISTSRLVFKRNA